MSKVNFERYQEFVSAVTSDASTNFVDFADRIGDLDRQGANIERLLTAGVGINAEGGEFLEIIKKMVFQGKPWNEDNRCLLYTSPSPRDLSTSRMPSSA